MDIRTFNIEQGMPTVEQARIRLDQALRSSRQQKHKVIKIIHGYGSSGKGGAIKRDVHTQLRGEQQKGRVKYFVGGEDFTPFDEQTRFILNTYPGVRKDKDYSRNNAGITIVML